MQKVSFKTIDGLRIAGTIAMPDNLEKQSPGVIFFHGMRGSMDKYLPLIDDLADNGIAGLAINMRGHGESDGDLHKNTVKEAVNDGLAAYAFLASQTGIDRDRIGLVGSSVGTILASMTTAQCAVKSLLLRAPAIYTEDLMKVSMYDTTINEKTQFHEIVDLRSTPAGRSVENFTGSLMVIASENDSTIPRSVSEGYLEIATHATRKQLVIIKDATHTLTNAAWAERFSSETLQWFADTL